ncbi:hypothetical protein C5167_035058 [Papaver somniferum]|uniref:Uncharacterized protein n=1 Tax=Papaver somniferum TaxID=3469 RepID=A0A4Y7KGC8_PAPSO|nr:hypothetical protein C5167_035058 [Papaver somniferum]
MKQEYFVIIDLGAAEKVFVSKPQIYLFFIEQGFTIKVIPHLYNEKGGLLLNLFLVFLLSLFQFNCGILILGIFGFRVTMKRRADGSCTLVVCGNAHERRTCIIVLPARYPSKKCIKESLPHICWKQQSSLKRIRVPKKNMMYSFAIRTFRLDAWVVVVSGEDSCTSFPRSPNGEGGSYDVNGKELRPSLGWTSEMGWTAPISKFQPTVDVAALPDDLYGCRHSITDGLMIDEH